MPRKSKSQESKESLKKAYDHLKRFHQEIKDAHMSVVLRLAIVAEYRDPDTGSHLMRLSDYGAEIAKAIQMRPSDIEVYRFASPLHDIGKIAMPDDILKKTGKLTEEERETMKKHTLVGARMFEGSKSPFLKAAAQICRHHHERWDGNGYPDGLKGDEIPHFARIVTVVDIFDALLTKRCYKEAWPWEEAVKYIKENSGKIFDPHLVTAFLKVLPTIRHIYEAGESIRTFVVEGGIAEKLSLADR